MNDESWGANGKLYERTVVRVCNTECSEHHSHYKAHYRPVTETVEHPQTMPGSLQNRHASLPPQEEVRNNPTDRWAINPNGAPHSQPYAAYGKDGIVGTLVLDVHVAAIVDTRYCKHGNIDEHHVNWGTDSQHLCKGAPDLRTAIKAVQNPCDECNGTTQGANHGTCWKCKGTGQQPDTL